MTQRIFDIENEKDYADLWDIMPDRINSLKLVKNNRCEDFVKEFVIGNDGTIVPQELIVIDWHDKTEITRPIKEATEADVGKLCKFTLKEPTHNINCGFGILTEIRKDEDGQTLYLKDVEMWYNSCYRLTKQEIEELC